MLRTTPFHPRTAPLVRAQTWRRWAGHQVASAYDPVFDRELAAIRTSAALIDVSPLYKYRITGRDARLCDRMVTRDVTKCPVGRVLYTPWCDGDGKVIDDGTLSRLDEDAFRLTSAEPSLRWLAMNAVGLDVQIADVSERTAALALQGPLSRAVLQQCAWPEVAALRYFELCGTRIDGIPVTVSRTGYTGDLGFELWVEAPSAVPLWDAVVAAGNAHGITPAGIWALDVARIEAGAPDARRRLPLGAQGRGRGAEVVAVRAGARLDRQRGGYEIQAVSRTIGRCPTCSRAPRPWASGPVEGRRELSFSGVPPREGSRGTAHHLLGARHAPAELAGTPPRWFP
jgi:glycine cleavage system aminomethyltransferase T